MTAGAAPRILVVEHESNAGIGLIGQRLELAGATVVTVGPEVGKTIPRSAAGFDGVIALGGLPGPADDDEAPWLPDVRALIAWCLETELPLLGVCLGAQMVAYVAGGTVGDVRNGPEVGVCDVDIGPAARNDAVLAGMPATVRAVQWHWLEIVELPATAELLGSSDACPHQAFRIGPNAWGLQFHLEALTSTVAAWAGSDGHNLRELGLAPAGVVDVARAAEPELRATWAPVADRWVDVVRRQKDTRGGVQ